MAWSSIYATDLGHLDFAQRGLYYFGLARHRKALTKRCKHIMLCVSILDTEYWMLYTVFRCSKTISLRPWASFGRVPISDYAELNTSRSGSNAGLAATTTRHILVDL